MLFNLSNNLKLFSLAIVHCCTLDNIYFFLKSEPMLFIFIPTFQNLYIFEQNSSFVLSNVPIVKAQKCVMNNLKHML